MAIITVQVEQKENGWEFQVEVQEGDSRTEHIVSMSREFYEEITKDAEASPEDIVQQSFTFLLERESKESILREFEITLIGHYFPEYTAELKKKLKAAPQT